MKIENSSNMSTPVKTCLFTNCDGTPINRT